MLVKEAGGWLTGIGGTEPSRTEITYINNKKKFLNKFGIYNRKQANISPTLFISGNINLKKLKASFYEISAKEKIKSNDIDFIEQEFNDYMLSEGFTNLFSFSEFKNFLRSVVSESD